MIDNPDPKRFQIRKRRQGDYILVDKQILRWRKKGKKLMTKVAKSNLGRPTTKEAVKVSKNKNIWGMFE